MQQEPSAVVVDERVPHPVGQILDCDARLVVTADGGYRRGAASALKPAVDELVYL